MIRRSSTQQSGPIFSFARTVVGIEYEEDLMRSMGKDESYPTNDEGVTATKKLLEKVGAALS